MSFVSAQAKVMQDEKRKGRRWRAYLRAKYAPKRDYTNFSGNYGGSGDDAWRAYFKSVEKYKHMSAW